MAAHRGCHVMSFASASLRTQLLGISGFTAKRINLSPFTKDFRAGEQFNESLNNFSLACRKISQIYNPKIE